MKKTSVSLPATVIEQLKKRAALTGVKTATLIRLMIEKGMRDCIVIDLDGTR